MDVATMNPASPIDGMTDTQIVKAHSGLIWSVARKWHRNNAHKIELSDLYQIGAIGMLRAARDHDPNKSAWSTHATRWITAYISRECKKASLVRTSQKTGYVPAPTASTSGRVGIDQDGDGSMTLGDTLGDESLRPDLDTETDSVLERIADFRMTDVERMIMIDRLTSDNPLTLEQIGRRIGVSKERVRQIEKALKDRIAKVLTAEHNRKVA